MSTPRQLALMPELDPAAIHRRAQATAARLREPGPTPRTGRRSDAVAAAHLDELWHLLGGWPRGSRTDHSTPPQEAPWL